MAGLDELGRDDLVALHAGVGADIGVAQVAQAGVHAIGIGVVGPGVAAQPGGGAVVAGLAGDAFKHAGRWRELGARHGERRMAGDTARVGRGRGAARGLRDVLAIVR